MRWVYPEGLKEEREARDDVILFKKSQKII